MSPYQRYLLTISVTILLFSVTDFALLQRSDVYLTAHAAVWTAQSAAYGVAFVVLSMGIAAVAKRSSGMIKDILARIADGLHNGGLFLTLYILFVTAVALFIDLAADMQRPLMDGTFVLFDQTLGFDWPATVERLNASPTVAAILLFCYRSIPFQVMLTGCMYAAIGRQERLFEFATTLVFALSIASLVTMAIPTAGAYAYYHPAAETFSNYTARGGLAHLSVLEQLRASEPFEFKPDNIVGLISFPSYHTSLGILITYAWRRTFAVFPLALVNCLMIVATVPEGGHHLADVIGGANVALISIAFVMWIGRNDRGKAEVGAWKPASEDSRQHPC
ncbi:phosphatase PAP2 family protein [Mesorhizobium sp. RCC_202]|uniref:phosphatase PAP2 family protein n=1 Tax=Mesorhizobium sp. RCC_202 TaxID=3239222 RepID=UPI003525486C